MSRANRPRVSGRSLMATGWIAIVVALGSTAARAADESPQRQIESRLMCTCGCSDLTVRTCTCGVAASMRDEVARRLGDGETAEQVLAAFVARDGEKILSAPTKEGFNLVGWFTPLAALTAAAAALVLLVRRWSRPGPAPAAADSRARRPPAPLTPPLTEEERSLLQRVERDLREGR